MELETQISCRHTLRVLRANGVTSLEQLCRLSREDLLAMRGIGSVIAGDLEKVIQSIKGGVSQ